MSVSDGLSPRTVEFYRKAMDALDADGVPFLVGGAYAFARYTGIERHTKDFDIFVHPDAGDRALQALARAGWRTEMTFPHWLGKAWQDDDFVDVIFSAGNGVAVVDDLWFTHSVEETVLGRKAPLIPAEEMIWSKGFIMERERYDGADVAHILLARADVMDWERVLRRFGRRWRVLMAHLVLFGFVYPGQKQRIPGWVMNVLADRLRRDSDARPDDEKICQGTLISREQYLHDIEKAGYIDARLRPGVRMDEDDVVHWTAAIATKA